MADALTKIDGCIRYSVARYYALLIKVATMAAEFAQTCLEQWPPLVTLLVLLVVHGGIAWLAWSVLAARRTHVVGNRNLVNVSAQHIGDVHHHAAAPDPDETMRAFRQADNELRSIADAEAAAAMRVNHRAPPALLSAS